MTLQTDSSATGTNDKLLKRANRRQRTLNLCTIFVQELGINNLNRGQYLGIDREGG